MLVIFCDYIRLINKSQAFFHRISNFSAKFIERMPNNEASDTEWKLVMENKMYQPKLADFNIKYEFK